MAPLSRRSALLSLASLPLSACAAPRPLSRGNWLTAPPPTPPRRALVPAPPPPAPPKTPIERVVVIIRENRTYDALFAGFPESAPGKTPADSDPRCAAALDDDDVYEEVEHGRERALDPGRQLRCFNRSDRVAVYHAIARRFTLCARFFSEVRGPSYPNHLMLIAGQSPKNDDPRDPPQKWACPKHCYDLRTFGDQLEAAGLSWRAYDRTGFISPFSMIRHLKDSPNIVPWQQFEDDARTGRLPHLSYLFSEKPDSDHPPAKLCAGQDFTLRQLRAIAEGPGWPSTAAFVLWDDWGGFYDHVRPPVIERDQKKRPLRYGFRVPCLVVSPYAKKGYLSRAQHSHLSVMRFAENMLGLPPLNERVAAASDMADCFDFSQPVVAADLPKSMACKG